MKNKNKCRIVRIEDICNPKQWKTISSSDLIEKGYPVYGANGIIGFYPEYNHEKETLLVTCRGATCGSLNICLPKSYVNGNAMALDNLDESCDIKFLYYYLKQRGFSDVISGSAQPQIIRSTLNTVKISLPPLETQKQIAKTLDTAAELLAMRKQELAELDNLIKSVFYDMFDDPVINENGWAKETLRSLSIKFSDGPFGSNLKTCHYEEIGIRVIRLNNIGVNEFINHNKAFISEKHYNDVLKKYTCYPGDVIIGTMGEPNVRACIVPEFIELSVNKADCILCRPNKNKVLSEYLCGVINSSYFLSQVSNLFHGQTRTRVSMGQLASLEIIVPPLSFQNQYVEFNSKIEEQKALVKKAIDETQYLFDSLMSEYFD